MKIETCFIPDVLLFRPNVYPDNRGWFREISRRSTYTEAGIDADFVQVNTSFSTYGVLRGMHFQRKHVQAKLVTVTFGSIYDVIVDCRPNSPTFGKWVGYELTAEGGEELWIPKGFAHGFQVTSKQGAAIVYQCNDYFVAGDEGGVHWNSPELKITWPLANPILSEKDAAQPFFTKDVAFPEVSL